MKTLLTIAFLLLTFPVSALAQNPILEIKDDKIPGRKLLIFPDHRYQFFPFPGTRPSEGIAVFEKARTCMVKFTDSQASHTLTVTANSCDWTGTATLVRVETGGFATYPLTDTKANQPPKK